MIKKLLTALIILFWASWVGAANFYVDCSLGTGDNDGTSAANAFRSLANLETYSSGTGFLDGDDVYFKSGVTCTLTSDDDRVQVRWSGVDANNRTIIGCYDTDDDFDCGATRWVDGNRGIIDGGSFTYPGTSQGVLEVDSTESYITVRELKVQNYNGGNTGGDTEVRGFKCKGGDYVNIDNCYFYRGGRGPEYGAPAADSGSTYGEVTNNYMAYMGYPDYPDGTGFKGAVIEISSVDRALGITNNITISGNYIHNSTHEGIGAYKQAQYITIENNIIRDVRSFHIYIGSSRYCTVRYNLVYESSDDLGWGQSEYGIASDIEGWRTSIGDIAAVQTWNGDNKFYGNFVAGMSKGVSFECHINLESGYDTVNCHNNTLVYNNTLVDNDTSLLFTQMKAADDIEVINNISYHTYSGGQVHTNNDSPAGTNTWTTNLFNDTDDTVAGDAGASNVSTDDPGLVKTSSWVGQAPDAFDRDDFKLVNTGSAAYDEGTTLGSPYNSDYWGTIRPRGSAYDIGAHEYEGITAPPVDYGRKIIR